MKYRRPLLVLGIIGLCAVALRICAELMSVHSPGRPIGAQTALSGFWADLCRGEGEEGSGGCEAVVKSKYGSIKLPWLATEITEKKDEQGNIVKEARTGVDWFDVPVAQIGQSYYILILIWFLFTGTPRRESRRWHLLPLVLAAAAAAGSIYYIYIMKSELQQWCKLCLLLHGIDFLILVVVVMLWPLARRVAAVPQVEGQEQAGGATLCPRGLAFRHVLAALTCAAVLVGASFRHRHDQQQLANAVGMIEGLNRERERADFVLNAYLGTPVTNIPRRASEITPGAPTAPHEMVIFSDLQCSACYTFENTLRDHILVNLWKGTMRYTFRHYPLCSECNPYAPNRHPQACQAAFALEAARIVGGMNGFVRMHHVLLQKHSEIQSSGFEPASYEKYAAEIGLDAEAFRAAFGGEEVRRVIEEDIRIARQIGATGTPTVFVDGRRLTSYPMQTNNPNFWQALAKEHTASSAAAQPANQ